MSTGDADVSVQHFEWLVEGRSRNQKSTLELYRVIDHYQNDLNNNAELQNAVQSLAAIAFSLWRAVFLSDTTGEFADQLADVRRFLISLISDNTVLYVTDKNARNWSFRYYLDNAVHRLEELAAPDVALLANDDLPESASDKDQWLNAQQALETALKNLEQAVMSGSK